MVYSDDDDVGGGGVPFVESLPRCRGKNRPGGGHGSRSPRSSFFEEPQVAIVATGHHYLALSFPLCGFPNVACFRILLQELADSVQMIIQTDSASIVAFAGV